MVKKKMGTTKQLGTHLEKILSSGASLSNQLSASNINSDLGQLAAAYQANQNQLNAQENNNYSLGITSSPNSQPWSMVPSIIPGVGQGSYIPNTQPYQWQNQLQNNIPLTTTNYQTFYCVDCDPEKPNQAAYTYHGDSLCVACFKIRIKNKEDLTKILESAIKKKK